MSDVRSNSSYAMSAIQFNSKSLNPLDSLSPVLIAKVKREAESYTNCAEKCSLIWQALAKNQMAGSHLTEKVLEVIFREFQTDLYSFTRISSIRQFMRLFDQDKDGSLNPDEQIAIFSFIKERLELVANNCLQLQLYVKFQSLMKEVRDLEAYIVKWQGLLRQKIHNGQLIQYRNEGQERVDQFCARFDAQFQELQRIKLQRREQYEKKSFYQSQELQARLGQPSQYLKIKPKNRLKQLQFQQKLVSLEERVYEALDFRRQLNQLEVKQKDRVDRLMNEHAAQQRVQLQRKHEKGRKQLEGKLEELQDKLLIRMKKQFEILRKKNNLHQIQIRRLQGLEKKWAERKGSFQPELKRTKKMKNQRNQVLEEYKKSILGSTGRLQDTISEGQTPVTSKFNARTLLDSTLKFRIQARSQSEQPLNTKELKVSGNTSGKIQKYIHSAKSGEKGFSLSKLYDKQLQPLQVAPLTSQQQRNQEKNRKYNFIMSKMGP